MIRCLLAVTLTCALVLATPAYGDAQRIAAGQEGDLLVPGSEHPCKLYVPKDYKPGARLPLIIFLHGSGGKPTSWPWKTATGGAGYFIAGLSYGAFPDGGAGGILSDPSSCRNMIKFIEKARALIDDRYGVDQRAVFLTGLSMGGWGTNFYGFHEDARGRYRGYAILAAGPRSGVDHSVAADLPVLLLNGSKDQNLAAANQGKPLLEKAGARVTQVVLEGEGHVPSVTSMAEPLRSWLDAIRAEHEREKQLAAVAWQDTPLGTPPGKSEDLAAYLAAQPYVTKTDPAKPVLVFLVSHAVDKKDKPTKAAAASAAAERALFSYPTALGPPSAARHFTCLRIDVSDIAKKASPKLHASTAPLMILLGIDRNITAVFPKAKLKATPVFAALRTHLSPEQIEATDARIVRITPVLKELAALFKKRTAQVKSITKARRRGPSKKLTTKENELDALDKQIEALREKLADAPQDTDDG